MATGSNNSSDTCSICTEKFNHPKLLPCFHTFCLECLQQFVSSSSKDGQFLCPLCRYQVTNFYIEARAEKQVHSGGECCGVCEQRATHSCREREILLCDTCTKYHQSLPATRSHLLVNLGDSCTEETFLSIQKYCEKHKDEKLRFYCTPCTKVICRDCKLTDHEGHKTKDMADVVEEARTSLTKTKVELEACKSKLEQSISQINDNNTETSKRISHVKEEINELVDSLVYMINKANRKEIDRVTAIEQTHGKKCSDEQYKLAQRKCFLQSLIDHTDTMLKGGLDCDIVMADSEMKRRLAEIVKEQLLDFHSKSLKVSGIPTVTAGLLDVVRAAVRNVMTHVLPVPCTYIPAIVLATWSVTDYLCESVYSITIMKNQSILVSYNNKCNRFLGLFDISSKLIWEFRADPDDLRNEGVQGVIEKHNKDNPNNKIPADDYTDLKKPFPYKDTNDNGDMCWVIKENNWVGIQTVSGDVRTLTFNPFAEPRQEFRPVDVCWGTKQEIYVVDGEADMVVVYSLQYGFQKSIIMPYSLKHLTAVVMDTDETLWVGASWGEISHLEYRWIAN